MKRSIIMTFLAVAAFNSFAADNNPDLGKQVYQKWCAPCHAPGDLYPGTLALRAKYKGALPDALEHRTDLNPEMIKYFVRNGVTIMPFFRKTEISDTELSAITKFLTKQPTKP
ncbi:MULTISPECIES: cytochrome c [unclassified Pseudomonas]|uniref:c-type cytochrome n=1 Tax=unclassified Pseudomonas TaxID=196821 RepID=UPI0008843A76|nr:MULTISPECIES: cytochrome c [unclassified Pseudomonas]SCZ05997.1 Cytochrome C oxidase, cbb3-type, subunit III [Pseudomonas sp. NFACC37-1]SFO82282.1 Cytochrome C oxidase, cbb3-type, subunit III [Pseudomonas sp. NFACC24-1]